MFVLSFISCLLPISTPTILHYRHLANPGCGVVGGARYGVQRQRRVTFQRDVQVRGKNEASPSGKHEPQLLSEDSGGKRLTEECGNVPGGQSLK